MTFEFSCEYDKIRHVLTDPRSWARMVNDSAPSRESFKVGEQDGIRYVVAQEGGLILGVFVILERMRDAIEIHFCICPEAWGDSKEIGVSFLKWLSSEPHYDVLYGPVPSYNRLALKLAKSVGFKPVGRLPHVGTRRGKSYDMIMLEYRKDRAMGAAA